MVRRNFVIGTLFIIVKFTLRLDCVEAPGPPKQGKKKQAV